MALELDPVSLIINSLLGLVYYYAKQPEVAAEQSLKTLEMAPGFPLAHSILGIAYTDLNRFTEAIAEGKKAVELSEGSSFYLSYLGWTYAQAGMDDEAKRIIEELQQLSHTHYVSPTKIALVYVGLNENDRAFELLEKAYEKRCERLIESKACPYFDPLRKDPRFTQLLKKIGPE